MRAWFGPKQRRICGSSAVIPVSYEFPKETIVRAFLDRYATPLTLGLFAISAISGVALFFHTAQGTFHEMHEWLSMLLLLPFAFHIWKNWRPLVAYARRGTLLLPILACLLVAVPFALQTTGGKGEGRGGPPTRVISLMTEAPLTDLAPLLKTTPDALMASLAEQGYTPNSADDTLATVAAGAGTSPEQLLMTLAPH